MINLPSCLNLGLHEMDLPENPYLSPTPQHTHYLHAVHTGYVRTIIKYTLIYSLTWVFLPFINVFQFVSCVFLLVLRCILCNCCRLTVCIVVVVLLCCYLMCICCTVWALLFFYFRRRTAG